MKQAILIVAFKDVNHLLDIIKCFDKDKFIFFIHINVVSAITPESIELLKTLENVIHVEQKYKTYWGSVNHLRSILYLSSKAIQHDVSYIHLISGQDYPVKSSKHFLEFFKNNDREYLEYAPMPNQFWASENGGYDRINFFHFNDYLNGVKKINRGILKISIKLQKILGFKRGWRNNFPQLFSGGTWWSLTKASLIYALEYLEQNPAVKNRFNNTLVSEEFLLQTILLNSPFKDKIVNNNLRYILWETKHGNRPGLLDEDDLELILKSQSIFARKIVDPISSKLKAEINVKVHGL
ncbi:MAG: beta-1,6-N-acetylglucosaminyltransferase [Pedobacter agri]